MSVFKSIKVTYSFWFAGLFAGAVGELLKIFSKIYWLCLAELINLHKI